MDIRIKEKLKNQQGSSLAFVLIIGMVIMIMVASLLAVANSDFTFAQETVESRQAYIDAKSVIEFGKIEINSREKKLSEAYNELMAAMNDRERAGEIPGIRQKITDLENQRTPIYGDVNNAAETLSFINDGTKTQLGTVFVKPSQTAVATTDTSQYVFKVETENLRRKLDYQVDYKYVVTTTPGSTGKLDAPQRPGFEKAYSCPETNTDLWKKTRISVYEWPKTKCEIAGIAEPYKSYYDATSKLNILNVNAGTNDLDIVDPFSWANDSVLNLTAKNICFNAPIPTAQVNNISYNIIADQTFGEIRFKQDYIQKNKGTNTLTAKTIVFEGDLILESNSNLEISCENLWVKGKIRVNSPQGSTTSLVINAKNIIVGENHKVNEDVLVIGSSSTVNLTCENNLWVNGSINVNSPTGSNSNLTVTAQNIIIDDEKKNQASDILVGSSSNVNLSCRDSLFVIGNIRVCYPEDKQINKDNAGSNSKIIINAKNACIGNTHNGLNGNVYIGSYSTAQWNCDNIWIDSNITTEKTGTKLIYNNLNYLKAGDISLDHDGQLIIEGESGQKNQIVTGLIKVVEGNKALVNISKCCFITCDGLELNDDSSLKLQAGAIKINGDFILTRSGVSGDNNSLSVSCEYFDCLGMTTITDLKSDLNFNQKNDILNVRFFKGYSQQNSTVNINGTDKVIFGPQDKNNGGGNDGGFNLKYYNSLKLNVNADNIYLASDSINIQNGSQFKYGGKSTGASKTNVYVESDKHKSIVSSGTYENTVPSIFPANLIRVGDYIPYVWTEPVPSCLGGSGGSTITISPGTEKYY